MIEFDYMIERDDGEHTQVFTPKIRTELGRLSSIRGPNSSGKSTLLHIIAGAFYGSDNERIHGALRSKIRNLFESDRNKIKFRVRITLPDGSSLVAEKPDFSSQISRYIDTNGKQSRVSKEAFRRRFDLIYDIPHDPTERLKELVESVTYRHQELRTQLSDLLNAIRHVQNAISESKTEEQLQEMRTALKNREDELSTIRTQLSVAEQDYRQLHVNVLKKRYEHEVGQQKIKETEVRALKKKTKKVGSDLIESSRVIDGTIEQVKQHVRSLITLNTQIEKDLAFIEGRTDMKSPSITPDHLYDIYRDTSYEVPEEVIDYLSDIRMLLEELESDKSDESSETVQVLDDIRAFFENLENKDLALPGVDRTIGEVLVAVYEQLEMRREDLEFVSAKNRVHENVERFETSIEELEDILLPQINEKLREKDSTYAQHLQNVTQVSEINDLESEIKQHQAHAGELNTEYEAARHQLKQHGEEENSEPKWKRMDVDRLARDRDSLRDEVARLKKDEERTERLRKNIELELKLHEGKEVHPLTEHQAELGRLANAAESLKGIFDGVLKGYIAHLRDRIPPENNDEERFYQSVYRHLGSELHSIRHLEETHDIVLANVVEEFVETSSGRRIYIIDMGTGQSQSAYIASILRQSGEKTLVAMFDEISMMDSKSLSIISEQLKHLDKRNQLACALVVQAGETLEVNEL